MYTILKRYYNNRRLNAQKIAIDCLKFMEEFISKNQNNTEKLLEFVPYANVFPYIKNGSNFLKNGRFREASLEFKRGELYIHKVKDNVLIKQHACLRAGLLLFEHDFYGLSQIVLFDKKFSGLFEIGSLKELKQYIDELSAHFSSLSLYKYPEKYMPHYCSFGIVAAKARCLSELFKIFMEKPIDVNKIEQSFIFLKKNGLHEAADGVTSVKDFILAFNEDIKKYRDLEKIPKEEEVTLLQLLRPSRILDGVLSAEAIEQKIEGIFEEKLSEFSRKVEENAKKAVAKEEKAEYARMWDNQTEPEGKPINAEEKKEAVINAKKYRLLIVREETHTQTFINGEKSRSPSGKLTYRVLTYILKHKGSGGTAWNIAKNVFDVKETEKFKDLQEMAKAVQMSPRLKQAEMQLKVDDTKRGVRDVSKLINRRIEDLNRFFFKKLHTRLKANELDEYELTPSLNYCFIEKI